MAIRRIVAAIDVVINGQRQIDNLARSYVAVERAANQASRAVRNYQINTVAAATSGARLGAAMGMNISGMYRMAQMTVTATNRMNSMIRSVQQAGGAFGRFVNFVQEGRLALERNGRATRGLVDNMLSLTKSMLLFSVLLPAVQMPQRIIESFGDFIKVGSEWNAQIRTANALLGLNEEQLKTYNVQVQQMAIAQGVATDQMEMFVTAASSVAGIKQNTEALNALGREAYNASVALGLATESARLARATNTEAAESQSTLIQVMSSYRLGMEDLTKVSDALFTVTDVGNVRFRQLEDTLPRITAAMAPFIQNADTAEKKMTVMNESFAAFAAMTTTMPPDLAATSFANIFKDISQMTGQQKALVTSWERIRKAQGLGEAMSLDPAELIKGGPMQALKQLRTIMSIESPLIDAYVANQRRMGSTQEESALRMTGQMQIMQAYFEDMRAVRGFVNISPELLTDIQGQYNAQSTGGVGRGIEQMSKTLSDAQKRMGAAWTAIRTAIFDPLEQPMIGAMNPIINMFSSMLENADFRSGNVLQKVRMVANALMDQFTVWFRGGGREQLTTVGTELGTFIGEAVTAFFRGGKDNVLVEAGMAFSEAFVSGISQTLPAALSAAFQSPLLRGIGTAMAARYVTKGRMPDVASRALAVAAAGGSEMAISGGGFVGGATLAGVGVLGAGALAAGIGLARGRTFPAGIPTRVGNLNSIDDIMAYLSLRAGARAAAPVAPGGPLGGLGRGARGPSIRGLFRGGGKIGGSALLNLALGIPAILSADSEREGWSAGGGVVGSILGGSLGALAGGGIASIATGIGGSILGGGLGGWAGGALYDMFHPGTGRGAAATEADAPERAAMAEVFATGFDMSMMVPLLTQIRDILGRGVAVGSYTGGSAPIATTGTSGTGKGLEQSFVKQWDAAALTELTPAQAAAACGPAAAAFFARANGRNPTLKEAYALVTELQGGDPAGAGGTRGVGIVGQALNKMGVANEVYAGDRVDWGRLAENAKAGVPGIVNIGPNKDTGFPGHYFQIGGWDPSNNKFNVGPNTMKGMSQWLTPQEMMALGPAMGAVYGLGGTGKGGITSDDVSAIAAAGTGMGTGGGGGGPVSISVQNLMNVEHMDGQTDVRALMGQMAEILRQLSSGGSVAGQTGAVAP